LTAIDLIATAFSVEAVEEESRESDERGRG
jgi:hypothetical protein